MRRTDIPKPTPISEFAAFYSNKAGGSASETMPVNGVGVTMPVGGASETMPVNGASETMPVGGVGETLPVSGASETVPIQNSSSIMTTDPVPGDNSTAPVIEEADLSKYNFNFTTEPIDRTYIQAIDGVFAGKTFVIEENLLIGRDAAFATLCYPDTSASIGLYHCKLEIDEKDVYITDLGSIGGTYRADGTRLKANLRYLLTSGECFYLSDRSEMFKLNIKES